MHGTPGPLVVYPSGQRHVGVDAVRSQVALGSQPPQGSVATPESVDVGGDAPPAPESWLPDVGGPTLVPPELGGEPLLASVDEAPPVPTTCDVPASGPRPGGFTPPSSFVCCAKFVCPLSSQAVTRSTARSTVQRRCISAFPIRRSSFAAFTTIPIFYWTLQWNRVVDRGHPVRGRRGRAIPRTL